MGERCSSIRYRNQDWSARHLVAGAGPRRAADISEQLDSAIAPWPRRQAAECIHCPEPVSDLKSQNIMRRVARNWVALANQMDRLAEHDLVIAAHLALAR
jgi:hypothetical protein